MRRIAAVVSVAMAVVTSATSLAAAENPAVVRLAGPNRYSTAVEISKHHHPAGADTVFVATGHDFPDGLAGAALAGSRRAPMLLTMSASIPAVTLAEIERLDPNQIVLLGGTTAVSPAAASTLGAVAPVTRIEGQDRYATAVAISQEAFADGEADVVVIATGTDFADALAGAPAAVLLNGPVLLTRPDMLPQAVAAEIQRLDPDQILLLGGSSAISQSVEHALGSIKPVTRIAGSNRYATAIAVSQHAFPDPAGVGAVYVAVGSDFPDALAGATAAAANGAPILLTQTAALPAGVVAEIERLGPDVIYILGGEAVIGPAVASALSGLVPTLESLDIALEFVAGNFNAPAFLTSRPGDPLLYVVEQRGVIVAMNESGGGRTEVFDIESKVVPQEPGSEQGLLGITFHPSDPSRLFVHYTSPASPNGTSTIEEYAFPPAEVVDPDPVATILTLDHPVGNHNGGMLAFGPDGFLYISMGDGGGFGDPDEHGQNPSTLFGSMLRLDVSSHPYQIPEGNPFADGIQGAPEVWAYGLRNPWRFSFDGDDIYIGDVGQGRREEIDLVDIHSAGANFGWNVVEGTHCFAGPPSLCADNDFVEPIHEYSIRFSPRCAVTGGYVYRGQRFPGMRGVYFFGDYCTGEIMGLRTVEGVVVDSRIFPGPAPTLSSFGVGPNGDLYLTRLSRGEVYRIVATG